MSLNKNSTAFTQRKCESPSGQKGVTEDCAIRRHVIEQILTPNSVLYRMYRLQRLEWQSQAHRSGIRGPQLSVHPRKHQGSRKNIGLVFHAIEESGRWKGAGFRTPGPYGDNAGSPLPHQPSMGSEEPTRGVRKVEKHALDIQERTLLLSVAYSTIDLFDNRRHLFTRLLHCFHVRM